VLRADGTEPVAFVAPNDVEGWISAIGKALTAPPSAGANGAFARAIGRKYSRQRMVESYLSLFEAYARPDRREVADLHTAVEEARP
jgi:glycosyltransferase involved in cell wall biosynthesis